MSIRKRKGIMDREEAIKRIQGLEYCLRNSLREEQKEALDMAIEALKGGDVEMPSTEQYPYMKQSPNSGADIISRAEALEQMAQAECGLHYADCKADNCTCDYIWRILNISSTESKTRE